MADNTPISLKEYARHRKARGLQGGSTTAVTRAVTAGRLVTSVTMIEGRPKIRSAAEADAEWQANTLPVGRSEPASEARAAGTAASGVINRSPAAAIITPGQAGSVDGIDFAEARRRHEVERWLLARAHREEAELELAARRGQLVNADEIRALVTDDYARCKSRLRGVPTGFRQRVPAVTPEAMAILVELVDEALEELADGSGRG